MRRLHPLQRKRGRKPDTKKPANHLAGFWFNASCLSPASTISAQSLPDYIHAKSNEMWVAGDNPDGQNQAIRDY